MSPSGDRPSSPRRALGAWLRAEILLTVTIFFCPLALACVHGWAIAGAAALGFGACLLTAWACVRSGERFHVPAPALAFAGAAAVIALQLVPLPPWLVGVLAPNTRAVFDFVLGPLGEYPAWRPLSLDPPATARELGKTLTCIAVFVATAQLVRSRRVRLRIATSIGLAGLAVALIGFGHALWGANALFGVQVFEYAAPPFVSTFGNPNHLASFLSLGATTLLARVLAERDRKIATLWAFAYVATGVGVLLSLSRGGIIAFLAAQLMLAIAVYLVRQSEREGVPLRLRRLAAPGAVLVVVAVSAYLAWEALAKELATLDSLEKVKASKLALWPSLLELVRAHGLVGVGRGAFETAYTRFQDPALHTTFTHPESILFQWTSEIGLPAGCALMATCVVAWGIGFRRAGTDVVRLACLVGVAGVALHEVVDFGLELSGLAVPATVAFAAAVSSREDPGPTIGRRWALAWTLAASVVAALALGLAGPPLREEGEALVEKVQRVPADEIAKEAARLAWRHPADYFPHLVAAQAYAAENPMRPEAVLAHANRVMFLNPSAAVSHRLAAQALRLAGRPAQARIEYRSAFSLGERSIVPEVVQAFPTTEQMREAVPETEEGLLALTDELMRQARIDQAEEVARAALDALGESVPILERLARVAQARKSGDEVFALGARMSELAPDRPAGVQTRVTGLMLKGDSEEAVKLLEEEGVKRFPLDAGLALRLAELKLGRGDTRGCRETLRRLPAGLDVHVRVRAMVLESRAAERDGHATKAVGFLRSAVGMRPDDSRLRLDLARLLERVGRFDPAIREAESVAAKAPALAADAEQVKARALERKKELEDLQRWKEAERAEPRDEPEEDEDEE